MKGNEKLHEEGRHLPIKNNVRSFRVHSKTRELSEIYDYIYID
jgi:hypothetical protein